jgi:hypothetical protein
MIRDEKSDNEETISALVNYQQNQSTNNSSSGDAGGAAKMQRPIVKMGR